MSCYKQSINPRPKCGHRHASVGCGTSTGVCGKKVHHFGVEAKGHCCEMECVPYEPACQDVWTSPAPETVQEAIERIAAAQYYLLAGGGYDLDGIPVLGGVTGSGQNGDGVNADAFVFCPPLDPIVL